MYSLLSKNKVNTFETITQVNKQNFVNYPEALPCAPS